MKATGTWSATTCQCFLYSGYDQFPDLIHAVKPEPHNAIPQRAGSAHDTFWVLSLMPETTHADVGDVEPRHSAQLRHHAGFWRAHVSAGQRRVSMFCKFHWSRAGTHSLVWDDGEDLGERTPAPPS
jgi:catalase